MPGVTETHPGGFVRFAVGAVTVGAGRGAVAVGDGDYATLMVGIQPAFVAGACPFVPHQGLVNAGAVDIAAQQGAGAVVFGGQVGAVIEQVGGGPADDGLAQPAFGIVAEAGGGCGAVGGLQAVVKVVAISPHAIASQVAVGVIGKAAAPNAAVLVEAVRRVAGAAVAVTRPLVVAVAPVLVGDPVGLVAGVGPGVAGVGQLYRQGLEGGLGVVGVGPGGADRLGIAVAISHGGAPRQVVVGVAVVGQDGGAIFQDAGQAVQDIVAAGDKEAVRPFGAGTVAGIVIAVRQGFAARRGGQQPPGIVPDIPDIMPGIVG